MKSRKIRITSYTLSNALGLGKSRSLDGLVKESTGLRQCDLPGVELPTWIGKVEGIEQYALADELAVYDCRNNRLAGMALQQDGFAHAVLTAVEKYGADRIGVFMGTSTSGIAETEAAYAKLGDGATQMPAGYRYQYTQNMYSISGFVRQLLRLDGPAHTISTACSSSAKVFATAYRYMTLGLIDAAVVGGVDSLCNTTLYGFNSLELVSQNLCKPWDGERDGINIGEAAGFALLQLEGMSESGIRLLGYGESSDAYHMSTPHPEGEGAHDAMSQALRHAGLAADDIDYINLHGTGTRSNDASEDKAVTRLFGNRVPCSSTKGWTGHTLGAAGITEALFACLCMEHSFMPRMLNLLKKDESLSANILEDSRNIPVNRVLSNSFGFGGSNCCLILGK